MIRAQLSSVGLRLAAGIYYWNGCLSRSLINLEDFGIGVSLVSH